MNKRMKVLVPTMIVVVMLSVIVFTFPAVAQAIQRWFGYIPGFGLVENSNIRSLAEPVQVMQNGITLTITDLTASSTKTSIKFKLVNIPSDAFDEQYTCKAPYHDPFLLLPDGSTLEWQALGLDYGGGTINYDITFSSVPDEVDVVTLAMNCISQTKNGSIPWNWSVPLSLASETDSTVTVVPVIQVPASTEKTKTEIEGETGVRAKVEINEIIPLESGYILSGSMDVDPIDELTVNESDGYLEDLSIQDANGKALTPTMYPGEFILENDVNSTNHFKWAVQIAEKDFSWPLTVTVNSITTITSRYAPSTFSVDVGQDPQADQEWMLDQDVQVGPKIAHVVSIKRIMGTHGLDGYELTLINDPSLNLNFEIENCEAMGGGGSGSIEPGEPFSLARSCSIVPVGKLNVILSGYGVEHIRGPWQVTVNEPVLP